MGKIYKNSLTEYRCSVGPLGKVSLSITELTTNSRSSSIVSGEAHHWLCSEKHILSAGREQQIKIFNAEMRAGVKLPLKTEQNAIHWKEGHRF